MDKLLNENHGKAATYAVIVIYFLTLVVPQLQTAHPNWRFLPELAVVVGSAWRAINYMNLAGKPTE